MEQPSWKNPVNKERYEFMWIVRGLTEHCCKTVCLVLFFVEFVLPLLKAVKMHHLQQIVADTLALPDINWRQKDSRSRQSDLHNVLLTARSSLVFPNCIGGEMFMRELDSEMKKR